MKSDVDITRYIKAFPEVFAEPTNVPAWDFIAEIPVHVTKLIAKLGTDYRIADNVAIHCSAIIEAGAVIKGPALIAEGCFIGAHAYLRGGVYVGRNVTIGPGCEVNPSAIFDGSALAHFNFVGDSLIGSSVNMEAGSILANYHNDREDKTIWVLAGKTILKTEVKKFGSLIGDRSKIGANAVCSPGTILGSQSIVRRLQLVEQVTESCRTGIV